MIEIHNDYQKDFHVSHETVEKIYTHIAETNKRKIGNINIIVLNDEELLQINMQYLNHDYYTDIITFDLSEDLLGIEAELYISFERIIENSTASNLEQEKYRVLIHGILHILGFTDKTTKEQQDMRKTEDSYLKVIGL